MKGIRNGFRQKIGAERAMLMLPFNVCMVARIRGRVEPEKLSDVLNKLRQRHALLAVRVVFEENGDAWLETKQVPDFELNVMPRLNENQWTERVEMEAKISFNMETGPLTRFILFHMEKLHKVFWEKNNMARLLAWTVSKELTKTLVSRCREEKVTVNSGLWTAFLAAQQETQAPLKPYHDKAGMAVSIRDKLLLPVGESFGFYAASRHGSFLHRAG